MLKIFVPDLVVDHYQDVSADKLREANIELFLCDIDNTLVAHDEPKPTQEVIDYLKSIEEAGIQVVLISNNTKERVETFGEGLGCPVYSMSLKPFPFVYRKIKRAFPHIKNEHILALGDQLLTDVLGANFVGIKVVLMEQLKAYDSNITSFNRMIENRIIKRLKKTGRWYHD